MTKDIKVGTILENTIREFTKVISVKGGMFGLTGWNSSRKDVEKSTVITIVLNAFGIEATEAKIVGQVGKVKAEEPKDASVDPNASTEPKEDELLPTKASLTKLSAEAVKALAIELKLNAEGNKGDVLERLFTHYELNA